jgi:hypothetical protein
MQVRRIAGKIRSYPGDIGMIVPVRAVFLAAIYLTGCQPTSKAESIPAVAGSPLARAREDNTIGSFRPAQYGADLAQIGYAQANDCKSMLPLWVYSEVAPPVSPAVMAHQILKDVPVGTPTQEIEHAADLFCLDRTFMMAVAQIESDFNPKNRTGKYVGLFQLGPEEFRSYGIGSITDARDNAIAAAWKFINEGFMFERDALKRPSPSDLYLIHQQGWQGAAEHVGHPERIAWKSMCATDEGKQRGDTWCKRAIWENTLPAIKHRFDSVEKLTSGDFVAMWRNRVNDLYQHFALNQRRG